VVTARSWLPAGRERLLWAAGAALALLIAIVLVVSALDGDATRDTPSPGSSPTSPSVSPSQGAKVKVDAAAYRGRPLAEVRKELQGLDLVVKDRTVSNPGGRTAGTVAALDPTGAVPVGSTITLDVWGPVPKADGGGGDGGKHKSGPGKKGKGKGKH
jgi:eukaryotic-like serine/threonine-protein kinase